MMEFKTEIEEEEIRVEVVVDWNRRDTRGGSSQLNQELIGRPAGQGREGLSEEMKADIHSMLKFMPFSDWTWLHETFVPQIISLIHAEMVYNTCAF